MKNKEFQDEDEVKLVQHWLSKDVTLETAMQNWFQPSWAPLRFEPCANFKHKIDRLDYTRYIFTGYIFEENEKKLSHGNR